MMASGRSSGTSSGAATPKPQTVQMQKATAKLTGDAITKKIEEKIVQSNNTAATTEKEGDEIAQLKAELKTKKKKKKGGNKNKGEKSKLNLVFNHDSDFSYSSSDSKTATNGTTTPSGGISQLHKAYTMERVTSKDSNKSSGAMNALREAYEMERTASNDSNKNVSPVKGLSTLRENIVANGSAAMRITSPESTQASPRTGGISLLRQKISELNLAGGAKRTMSAIGGITRAFSKDNSAHTSGYNSPTKSTTGETEYPITDFCGSSTPNPGTPPFEDSGVGSEVTSDEVDKSEQAEVCEHKTLHEKRCPDDFTILKCLGKGSFGTVHLVRENSTGRLFAQKQFKKASISVKNSVINQTMTEREILELVNKHPFIVKLYYAFQDQAKLYLILEYGCGGELFWHVDRLDYFLEDAASFYVAETLLALEHLHKNFRIVYRDLKPENCVLDEHGHLLLTDFGLSKVAVTDEGCKSILGTKDYMAPEVVKGRNYGLASDFWALGCFAFHLMTGQPPWYSNNDTKTEQKILHGKLKFPHSFSPDAKDLITRLLRREPKKRLQDTEVIKGHRFFKNIDWAKLERREVTPPITPAIAKREEAECFSKEFTELPLSPVVSHGSWDGRKDEKNPFGGFSYVASKSLLDGYGGHFGGKDDDYEGGHLDDLDDVAVDGDVDTTIVGHRDRARSTVSMMSM